MGCKASTLALVELELRACLGVRPESRLHKSAYRGPRAHIEGPGHVLEHFLQRELVHLQPHRYVAVAPCRLLPKWVRLDACNWPESQPSRHRLRLSPEGLTKVVSCYPQQRDYVKVEG